LERPLLKRGSGSCDQIFERKQFAGGGRKIDSRRLNPKTKNRNKPK
jgi:hypothetical protein